MAVTFRAASQVINAAGATNTTGTEPAGAASGDVLLAVIEVDGVNVTSPAGWTDLVGGMVTVGVTRGLASYLVRGGSAPSYVWTHGASTFDEVDIVCLKTSGGTISLDSQSASGATGTSNHQPDPPNTNAVATSSLAVCWGINTNGSTTIGAPTGYVLRSLDVALSDIGIADKSLSGSGGENPAAFSGFPTASTNWWDGGTVTFTDVTASDTQEWKFTVPPRRLRDTNASY